jgi:hypothetical protein
VQLILARRDLSSERLWAQDRAGVNAEIARIAARDRRVVLEPDFEPVAGLAGHSHKPNRAWSRFAVANQAVPNRLAEVNRRVLRLVSD